MTDSSSPPAWSEETSQAFLAYAPYLIARRREQMEILCRLITPSAQPLRVLELGCGEGLLAEAILRRFAHSQVTALDRSEAMLAHARRRLAPFGGRAEVGFFDLAAQDWRTVEQPFHLVVSSLVIHHLDGEEKRRLYQDLIRMLALGGALVIADVIAPAGLAAIQLAAQGYDQIVAQQARAGSRPELYEYFQQTGWNLFRYPDPMDKPSVLLDQLTWLQQAGFTQVDVYWLEAGHAIFGGRKSGAIWPVPVEQARPLRLEVLRPGQPVQAAEYPGDDDPRSRHLAAFQQGEIVGVCSVYPEAPPDSEQAHAWRLRGVAVQAQARRAGYGRALILACLDYIAEQGGQMVWCNARVGAAAFYEALGFSIVSDRFEVPISGPHYRMARPVLAPPGDEAAQA